ncbi:YbhB/YbcL family Raf kinase inhibitor-like protein [uncultured Traorella sp.]|uniref:YbhB/YbcL family Raf kinase inhibitor-like protein n=1 Tax=uncultured Traorella sp. TaxID=1929048 RepID=UPI0025F6DEFC|nr:YbhB/YbcL family Raf kinase inhibitor-like protein [uncultured Traorella sp.]
MKVTSIGLKNGVFDDKYGKRGPEISIPFQIEDAPENTKSFAFLFEDKDAIPVCGFSFIHWVGWNLTRNEVYEGESETAHDFISGYHSRSKEMKEHYVGMAPPDKDHIYELHVYALDCMIDLDEHHYFNDLYWKMEGHILEEAVLKGIYKV